MKRLVVLLLGAAAIGGINAPAAAQEHGFAASVFGRDVAAPAGGRRSVDRSARPDIEQADLGGGLIEFLVTGRQPSRRGGAFYNEPTEGRGAAFRSRGSLDRDFTDEVRPAPRRRYSAVPGYEPIEGPIGRVIDPRYEKQVVEYDGGQAPGTIIVDTPNRFLFLVQPGGKALRYGIGVGRPGFTWAGVKTVSMKREWPDWRPPAEMLKRRPDLPRYMKGGPDNPLGARALYLGSSLYRIHGTNEPHTIGEDVSSGCIRMTNDDVVDLYQRVSVGAKVIVR